MEFKKGLIFGIDLGIGSVGWAVLDDGGKKYIDKGFTKFGQASKADNRRNGRGSRRRLHRKKYRIERMEKILKQNGFPYKNVSDSKLLDKRIKGIENQIEKQDITNIILYFVAHRGYISFDKEVRESEIIKELSKKYEYPCLIQKELLKINNVYRNKCEDNPILHTEFNKELIKILKTQSKYYNNITDEFITQVLEIINTKRKFWEGPGAPRKDALSPFGRYRDEKDLEEYKKNPNYRKYIFEDLIGNCSVYAGEKKASMFNYYAEEFNFYNDFVNLRFFSDEIDEKNIIYFNEINNREEKGMYKLTTEAINLVKNRIFELDSVDVKKIFKELFNVTEFKGNRIKSDGKPDFYRFQTTKQIKKKVNNKELYDILFSNKDLYNKVIDRIQISPDIISRYEMIKDAILESKIAELNNDDFISNLSEVEIDKKIYHSFSEKALKKYLEYMYQDNINSSKVERKYKDEIASDVKEEIIDEYLSNIEPGNLKYINPKFIDDLIASPTTKNL